MVREKNGEVDRAVVKRVWDFTESGGLLHFKKIWGEVGHCGKNYFDF